MARSTTSAVDKALDLIEILARSDEPCRLTDLADEAGMHRATAYRVLVDLVRRGWVLRYGDRYLPGTVMLQLNSAAAASSFIPLCRPVLKKLAAQTDMMTNLQVLEADGSRILDVVRPPRYALLAKMTGEFLPVHRFAGPLALVAALDDGRAEHYVELAESDGYDIEGERGLRADLTEVRKRGYALVRRRTQDVVASASQVVAARTGAPLCALTVVGLDSEFDDETSCRIIAALADAVEELQSTMTNPQTRSMSLSGPEDDGDEND